MKTPMLVSTTFSLALFSATVSGCASNDPKERAADAIESNASEQASAIKAAAAEQAGTLRNQSDELAKAADQAGGFQGQTLDARAEALRKESNITKAQGAARADAVKTAGDARAKAIRSQ
jgi:hypothetical protein